MTNDEIAGRLIVLEAIATASLSMILIRPGEAVDPVKAHGLLDSIRQGIAINAAAYPREIATAARDYADHYLSHFLESIDALDGRTEPPRP